MRRSAGPTRMIMARFKLSFRVLLLAALAACTPKASREQEPRDAPARRVLLQNLAERVILRSYQEFEQRAQALANAADAYASAPAVDTRGAAQQAFREAL